VRVQVPPSVQKPQYLFIEAFFISHIMATVYIIYAPSINRFYIGSCQDLNLRLNQHLNNTFNNSYTKRANDWELFFKITNLEYQQARKIEIHIKKMKSKVYILNLKRYPNISLKLIQKYK
jgi:putative endonuclease